jgi:uncharacterized damage-inducible protein DinB
MSAPLRDHFVEMAKNNAWSNLRLYAACRTLDAAALGAPRTSFFPSILETLQHLWIVDEYYVDGLERGGRGAKVWLDEGKLTEIEGLWSAQRAVDRRLSAVCERFMNDEDLEARIALERSKGPVVDRARDILAHLFVHQIHHRGQVHAMLAGTTVKPPQLDEYFLALDRPIAEKELAAHS